MKKYSRPIAYPVLALILCGFFSASGADRYDANRKKIIEERIKSELSEIDRRLATVTEQHDAAARKYLVSLSAHKKLQLLKRSAAYHKAHCLWFDDECRRLYDMTTVYLESEIDLLDERMVPERAAAISAAAGHRALRDRRDLIGNATFPESFPADADYDIPELRGSYRCIEVEGWNPTRGIFVEADEHLDLPFSTEVTTIHRERNAAFIATAFRDVVIQYAYTGEPSFFTGELVPPYTPLFERPSGNPIVPGTVLITILRKEQLVDPSFLCRH
jgi:hypothetical protein